MHVPCGCGRQLETAQRLYGFDPAAAGAASVASPSGYTVPGTPTPQLQQPPGSVERRARGALAASGSPSASQVNSTGARVATHRRMGELLASATASGLGATASSPGSPGSRVPATAGTPTAHVNGGTPSSAAGQQSASAATDDADGMTVSVASYRKAKDRASALQKRCHRYTTLSGAARPRECLTYGVVHVHQVRDGVGTAATVVRHAWWARRRHWRW